MQANMFKFLFAAAAWILIATACSSKAADSNKAEIHQTDVPLGLPVDVIIARESEVSQEETVAGSILPNRSVDVMSEQSRKITQVSFSDGSHVRKGQILFKLDDSDIRAKIRQLRADLHLAAINEQRLRELLKSESVRQEEYDIALARLHSLQAAEEILQDELSKTFIKAPFAGVIGISKVFEGSFVSPGMPLVTLQEQDKIKIAFSISEKYLPFVKKGNTIFFSTELNSGKVPASIISTEAGVDVQSRNITVHAIAANRDGSFKPGMSARIHFKTAAENTKGLLIPTEALMPGGTGYSVFVVKNNMAKTTPVVIADRNEKEARIRSGIAPGDTVLVSNLLRAADGSPLTIVSVK